MLNLLDSVMGSSHMSPVTLNWQKDTALAGPYREVRDFRAPSDTYDILEGNRRGVVFKDAEDNLFFVDAIRRHNKTTGKWEVTIHEHGFKKLSGLPRVYANFKHNPNEWKELLGYFTNDPAEDVKKDLLAAVSLPPLSTKYTAVPKNDLQ